MLSEPQPVDCPSERGRNYTPPEGSVLRPAGASCGKRMIARSVPAPANHHRGSYTSPALAAASYPFVDLPSENILQLQAVLVQQVYKIILYLPGLIEYNENNDKSKFVMVDNMEWFNVFGLIFIAVIMIPNVVFAIKCKDGFDNKWNNKYVEVTEQVGRLGCFGFMIINIPGTWFGWWSDEAFALYLIVDTILVMLYCAIWIICFKKNSVFRALALSIIPSMLFLFSGIMSRSVLLIIASVLFAPSHIVISYKNVK